MAENGNGERVGGDEGDGRASRKRRLRDRFGDAVSGEDPGAKAARLRDLQASIAAQIASTAAALGKARPGAPSLSKLDSAAADGGGGTSRKRARDLSVRLDEFGREIDESGALKSVRESIAPVLTLKANQQVVRKRLENPYLAHRSAPSSGGHAATGDEALEDEGFDTELRARPMKSKLARPALTFVEEGKFSKRAQQLRSKELEMEHKRLVRGISGVAGTKEDGVSPYMSSGTKVTTERKPMPPPRDGLKKGGLLPAIEWWDGALLPDSVREGLSFAGDLPSETDEIVATEKLYAQCTLEACGTFKYVQHPPPLKNEASTSQKNDAAVIPVFLTKKERKRLRKVSRLEREQEKRDKIALGLMPAPEPKMKMSNFMKILGEEAIQDPSRVEAMVRQQMSAREKAHLEHNASKKLTSEQRAAKMDAKLAEKAAKELVMAVFRVSDLSDPRSRFKVDLNAQQWKLTGCAILCPGAGFHVVLVEGGSRAIKHYTRLMLKRIKWGEASGDGGAAEGDDQGEEELDVNDEGIADSEYARRNSSLGNRHCELVWRGVVPQRSFQAFRFQEFKSPEAARKMMHQRGLAHFWDLCSNGVGNGTFEDGIPILLAPALPITAQEGGADSGAMEEG